VTERLRRVEDILEIQQLFVDYGRRLDRGDFAGYAELFAEDGEIRLGPVGRARGRKQIQEVMTKAMEGIVGTVCHIVGSPEVTIDGDRATADVMWTVIDLGGDGQPRVSAVGRHVDELVRENGRWRFARRSGRYTLPPPPPR
jgi:uncharacterized protein (TIGR02246 family)